MSKNGDSSETGGRDPVELSVGHDEIVIRHRYQALSIANDFLIALWFLIGSVFFLFASLQTAAIALFIAGSVQFLARPTIRLAHSIHLKRVPESEWEF